MRRRERIIFGIHGQVCANRVRVNVVAVRSEVARIFDAALCEAVFPNRRFGFETERESALDELHGLFDGDVRGRRDEEMDVIGHEDEGMDRIATLSAVVVHQTDQEIRVGVGLEGAAAVRGDGGDEEGADFLRGELGHEVEGRARRGGAKDYERARDFAMGIDFWGDLRARG